MSLHGKTLFISGGSRGIGLAIALRAARDGANVAIAAKSSVPNPKLPGTIHSAAQAVNEAGGSGLALQCDIREEDQIEAAVTRTVERFGGIDICINNASAIHLTGTLQTEPKRLDLMQNINACAWCPYTSVCGSEHAADDAEKNSMKNDEALARMENDLEKGSGENAELD